jgi:restriction endonuclease S subunit
MARSTTHYADSETNNILKRLHNKLRPAGTPVERVEYIIELLLLRIFEAKVKQDEAFKSLRKLFEGENYRLLFSHLLSLNGEQILSELNKNIFPFYSNILSKARTVVSGNLPQKMQDQLVLMEEVFANSNFTNNVKGGVIAEVIGMVNEIDEKYILKTDLLGDAIESALSETGGTKDLGLYRTPDHIRQMMVEMVDPDFTDTIFDPACGTAGFLFDAYDYVIEKAQKSRQMPSEGVANMFYRTGISGIEYQGRIRKMAAVNMYIRGLNPHNIDQGDSLKMFDPPRDSGSKSVVIANPPFGAERDQPAYPNVWEEYSKESETTILFVKLMFDLLKANGRCAVVVSEGFLTWGQNSAHALRKILLNEANLRAVISLPQGVFVSKSGQGAKTSILYFEKGQPTDSVWYYKIENDGFSMGTNRKEIVGNQIPELLEIFKEVKQGKKPQDTKHSFCISKEQIETLDPRIAERIKREVSEKTKEKNIKKREKLVEDLDKKLKDKKISKELHDEKLWQFDNIIEGQIDNEVAKAIEKAHSYHFNLQNYRSSLSDEQIKDWQETLKGVEIKNGSKIERRYQELQKAEPKIALQILASFDTKNAMQMDIAREYLSKLEKKVLEKNEKLQKLEEILRKGFKYPIVSLKELIIVNDERIKPLEFSDIEFTVLGVSNQTGVFINEKLKGSEIKQGYFKVYKNQFCYNPYRINVGSIGFSEFDFENQIISGAYNVFGCNETLLNPKYLEALFKTKRFLEFVNEKANGGVRMDFKIESMQEWQVPIPPIEIQSEIVEKIEKQNQVIKGAQNIEDSLTFEIIEDTTWNKATLDSLCKDILVGGTPKEKEFENGNIAYLKVNNLSFDFSLNFNNKYFINDYVHNKELKRSQCYPNDVLMNIVGPPMGKIAIVSNEIITCNINQAIICFRVGHEINNRFLAYYLLMQKTQNRLLEDVRRSTGQWNLTKSICSKLVISFPPLEIQHQIVEKLDRQMQALEGVRLLKSEAEKRIEEILAGVWGVE